MQDKRREEGGGKGGEKLHVHVVDNSDPILECSKSHNTIMCRLQLVGFYISCYHVIKI